ncbi:hypothetical protein [Bradyrhizobium guangzhouense]|uniref:Uncharacterized protein n=1 Tax=Bradyrhizobium guangzhouense TaxID=1325095 RepID=A0AAE6C917_9BRAD|nr:hypothetical protein [Bradyrhizobium guangzhouense]QAU47216.1 hypothetical protein XH91_18910 [Bradyrhizobium guangzhouense]RXH13717.1 hypothetical protein EAS56_14065 [Bradyrhizobium guangzhouense]
MTDKWPPYEVADQAVVHALGVMNINYVRFERTHVWMLAATGNLSEQQAIVFSARTNPSERANFIDMFFARREWPEAAGLAIRHYIAAMRIITGNRNSLIHGNIVTSFGSEPAIFSLNRQGTMTMFRSSLADIRRVADDAEIYFQFGLSLANYIATEIHAAARQAGMLVVSNCPALPALPLPIRPTS